MFTPCDLNTLGSTSDVRYAYVDLLLAGVLILFLDLCFLPGDMQHPFWITVGPKSSLDVFHFLLFIFFCGD